MNAIVTPNSTGKDTLPFYLPTGREIDLCDQAHRSQLPLMLKGPTGCGKTRFVEHMAARLGRELITVSCNEDTSATDLLGVRNRPGRPPGRAASHCRGRAVFPEAE